MTQTTDHADLEQLFLASEAKLGDEDFVGQVMKPIHRRMRLRQAVLFGAGGIGVGAAASQLIDFVALRWSQFGLDTGPVLDAARDQLALLSLPSDPVMLAGLAMLGLSVIAMATMERT